MNILSLLSFPIFILSFGSVFSIAKLSKRNSANQIALALLICVALFALTQTFFYVAPTKELAWFWHKLGAVGWISFITLAFQYTLFINNRYSKYVKLKYRVIINAPTAVMIAYMWITESSPAAQDFILSPYGLGWCFSNSTSNHFLWIFLVYLLLYTGVWFHFIFKLGKNTTSKIVSKESKTIAIIDFCILLLCLIFDFLLPLILPGVSPVANLILLAFVIRLYISMYRSSIFTIMNFVTPQVILDTITDPMLVLDMNGNILRCNQATYEWLGSQNDLVGNLLSKVIVQHLTIDNEADLNLDKALEAQELICHTLQGSLRIMALSISIVRNAKYGTMAKVLIFRDITNKKNIENQLRISKEKYKELAFADSLTKLPNRRVFFEHINNCVALYHATKTNFAIIMMDLNNFKYVNDTYGHSIGDKLLIEVGSRLNTCLSPNTLLARIGGDEFAMLLEDMHDEVEIITLIDAIYNAFEATIVIDGVRCPVTISIGYSKFSDTENAKEIFQIADKKMFENKRQSKLDSEFTPHFRT